MSLYEELFGGILGDPRPKSPEVAATSPEENGSTVRGIAQSPRSPARFEKNAVGDAACPTCGCGSFWRDRAGAWHCEGCNPPGAEHVTTWRNLSGGKVAQGPAPAEPWLAELDDMLNRVSCAFEWMPADRADFIQWARRSAQGMADAAEFLRHECEKLKPTERTDQ